MSDYTDGITANINKSLKNKLKRELRGASRAQSKLQHTNAELTRKRRHCEDRAQARALGCKVEEIL
jgi:hypothetical protein